MNSSLTQVLPKTGDIRKVLSKTIDIRKSRTETIGKVLHAAHSVRIKRQEATLNFLSSLQKSNFIATIRQRETDFAGERDRFSIFDLVNANYNELFHSATIAWLLGCKSDYKHNHNLGNVPMRLFVRVLNSAFGKECIPEHSFDGATVEREKHGIDILIKTKTECIIIENKIKNAPDQPEQLKRYYNSMKETHTVKAIVYLTPDGHSPGEDSMGDEKDNIEPLLINLPSYALHEPNLATGMVDAILSSCYIDNLDILSLVRQYGLFLKKIRGDYIMDLNIKDFLGSITKGGVIDKDLFETVFYIKKLNLLQGINEKVYNDLQTRITNHPSLKEKLLSATSGHNDNNNVVYFDFKTKSDDRFGIDLRDTNWGSMRIIELFYRQENSIHIASKDNFEAIRNILNPIVEKAGYRFERRDNNPRLYCGGVAGIPYVGNEDVFYKLVIDILDALA